MDDKWTDFNQNDIFINDNDIELPYKRRKDEEKKSVSFGQRKLLLTVVQFLSLFYNPNKDKNCVVVYAGAAPGNNIEIISRLFPELLFHLYDPRKFKVKNSEKIQIYQQYFTDKEAEFYKDKNVLFISDIRTADYTKTDNLDENESQILLDMEMQKKWVEIMKPIQSHLKFRLPYSGGTRPRFVKYFNGLVFKQQWAPQTTTETRLVPIMEDENFIYKDWDCRKYESQLFYHNTVIREKYNYYNPFTGDKSYIDEPELMNDWDSRCETQIWMDYLNFRNAAINKENVTALSRMVTSKLTKGKKYIDTLEYLRSHPRAIKTRNFLKTRDDRNIEEIK